MNRDALSAIAELCSPAHSIAAGRRCVSGEYARVILDGLSRWLTLCANLGIVIGLVLVALQQHALSERARANDDHALADASGPHQRAGRPEGRLLVSVKNSFPLLGRIPVFASTSAAL